MRRALRIPRLPPPSHMASHDAIAPPILAVVGFKSDPKREDRIISYKGKEKDLSKVLIPQEIRQPIVGRYEGMLEIAGHEILVTGVAGRENGSMLYDQYKTEYFAAYIDSGSGICTAKPGVFPKEARETLPVIAGRDFSQKILILNTGIREAKIMIGGAFGTPWFRVLRREKAFNRIMPINFRSKRGDVDAKLTHPKMQDKRKFGIELQEHIVEKIRNFPDILKDKKQLQSFLGVVNFAGIFIKDLAKYRKDFRPLLKETDSAKWKWEEIHTQRVRELKQVCNNLPKLAIPQDEDELVVYTDANDYRWAAVLMKRTTTGEEPCRYTRGLFNEQQARVWHINEKEFFAIWKAFKKWPLFLLAKEFTLKIDNTNAPQRKPEELDREFGRLAVNAQVAGQVQRADLDIVQTNIRSSLVASTALWNALQEPIRKASPSAMTRELREQRSKPALRVQDSKPVAADSSTACTRPSPDSGEQATIESQGVQTSNDSSQPSASGVKEEEISLRPMTGTSKANTNELISLYSAWQDYQRKWEKLVSRKGVNPSKTIIKTSGKYNRVWMLEGSNPEDVKKWYEFEALASVHTMSPSFPEISKLPEWISGAVYDSWQNNPHLKEEISWS
ncbi:UNVERIFIED_CONTAM: Enzymatic polyprotein [Sesamum calycinum]|uniref:Enzymatic polyprotein n=1 Tax=Sesamum calycinum TaxID=2727403 RepID=A0AAW2ITS2_9LAMI